MTGGAQKYSTVIFLFIGCTLISDIFSHFPFLAFTCKAVPPSKSKIVKYTKGQDQEGGYPFGTNVTLTCDDG